MGQVVKQWNLAPLLADYETVVATNGCFDILHCGHKRLLEQARGLGDVLVVAVNDDAGVRALKRAPRPMIPDEERAEMLAAFWFVDYVVIFVGSTAEGIMATIKPDIYVKGDDTDPEKIPERAVVEANGGVLKLLPVTPGISSTAVLSKVGASEEVKNTTFNLYDTLEHEIIQSSEVAKQNIVLSADGKLLVYQPMLKDGQRFPTPGLAVSDVSTRYGILTKVASG